MPKQDAPKPEVNRAREVARLLAKAALRRIALDNATGRTPGSEDQADPTTSSSYAEKADDAG